MRYYELNNILGEISTYVYNDESQVDVYEAATDAMEIEMGQPFKHYKKFLNNIIDKIDKYKEKCPIEGLENQIKNDKAIMSKQSEMFVKSFIRGRYQDRVYRTLQNYKNSLIKVLKRHS